jgi:hypothetical protein
VLRLYSIRHAIANSVGERRREDVAAACQRGGSRLYSWVQDLPEHCRPWPDVIRPRATALIKSASSILRSARRSDGFCRFR